MMARLNYNLMDRYLFTASFRRDGYSAFGSNNPYSLYWIYPEYPVADAGYGSYNNYLYCEQHGMKKYMKFTMYDKGMKDKRYRAENFRIDAEGIMRCPNGKGFHFRYRRAVKGNQYGRQGEIYECEDCSGCLYKACSTISVKEKRSVRVQFLPHLCPVLVYHFEFCRNTKGVQGCLLYTPPCTRLVI